MRIFVPSKYSYKRTTKFQPEDRLFSLSSVTSPAPEEAGHYWFAFLLFSLKQLSQKDDAGDAANANDKGFNLCQVL